MASSGMSSNPLPFLRWWRSLIPVAGCAVLAGSDLWIYLRDLRLQAGCETSIVCRGFQADPRLLAAGWGFAYLALALGSATAVAAAARPERSRPRRWLAPLVSMGVASSFAVLVAVLTLSGTSSTALQAAALTIWAFLGVGYLALWAVAAFPSTLVGGWRYPARVLAYIQGIISVLATLASLAYALGPGPMFL